MQADLHTTNVILGVIAGISVFQTLMLMTFAVGAYVWSQRLARQLQELEAQTVKPAIARVNAILDEVHDVSRRVSERTHQVDEVVQHTIDHVDRAATLARLGVRMGTARTMALMWGVRTAFRVLFGNRQSTAST